MDELRDELHRFGEACHATLEESLQSEAQARSELARVQRAAANVVMLHKQQEQELAVGRLALEERANEVRVQNEASSATAPVRSTVSTTPVMDMRFCIDNLDAIRAEAGDFSLKDFSDYWAPDNGKTAPSAPNIFVRSLACSTIS